MEKISSLKGKLLEGCVWDEINQVLYFVDIECRKIYKFSEKENNISKMEMPDYVSCIVLEKEGTLIAALPDGLYRVDFDEKWSEKAADSGLKPGIRYNDGKCDHSGRIWIGSMAIAQNKEAEHAGSLYCIEKEQVCREYPGFTIPNGLAWNEEGTYFYHIDTPTRKVDRYIVGADGSISDRQMAVDLSRETGNPDGMCIDSEGHLWIAMWGGGKVVCADPETGKILEKLVVGDKYVSCCTFGGAQMNELFITTARDEEGNGGELYVHKMKAKGVKAERYGK